MKDSIDCIKIKQLYEPIIHLLINSHVSYTERTSRKLVNSSDILVTFVHLKSLKKRPFWPIGAPFAFLHLNN